MKLHHSIFISLILAGATPAWGSLQSPPAPATQSAAMARSEHASQRKESVSKLLVIGDSMTGWIGERLAAYGQKNGFEVATIVWDGSTIKKWGANEAKIKKYVDQIDPDAVMVCLGLNESAEKNPQSQLGASYSAIMKAIGDLPVVWIGPPEWPGKNYGEPLNGWLATKMGDGAYFESLDLPLPRQSATNPHPSREGIAKWVDALMQWMPGNAAFQLPGYEKPSVPHTRGKTFIYRKMKDPL